MKSKYNMFLAALLISGANAADIDVFGVRNNPGDIGVSAPTYTATNYIKPSFASVNGGLDGGLGTSVYVVHDDANLDGDGDPKTVTWFSTNNYFVRDKVFIPKGTTLTIQPGTKIYGGTNDNGTPGKSDDAVGAITACRGGKLIADGTAAAPIVFTSVREWEVANGVDSNIDQDAVVGPAPTSADAGLWGGIILLGQAYCSFVDGSGVNAGTVQIEGFAPAGSPSYDGDTGGIPDATQYGTSAGFPRKDDDNSGIVRYVSIRHGGYEFSSGKEINGLTMGAVGSGTTIEFVEVYANLDDGLEFFGGRVSTNNIVVAFVQDDIFDIDEGYRGTNQFWLGIQNPGDADAGGEWDGVGGSSGGYSTISTTGTLHHAKPIIYNATILGAGADNAKTKIPIRGTGKHVNWEKGNAAFHLEDYFNGEVYNSVYHDFSMGVIRFNDTVSVGNNMVIENCTFGDFGTYTGAAASSDADYINGTLQAYDLVYDAFGDPVNGNTPTGTDLMLTAYTRDSNNFLTALNPVPAPGSPLLTAPISGGAPKNVTYRGAFGPEGNWAAGWTKLSESGVLTGAAPAPAIVDTDGDGIDDALENTQELQDLGFVVGNDDSALFASIYTEASILELRTTAGVTVQKVGNDVTLSVPVEKSTGLNSWAPAGNMTLGPFLGDPNKEFYRLEVKGAQ